MKNSNIRGRHNFVFNPKDNGGESLSLLTKFIDNGDGEIYTNQELSLQSYCNSASFTLIGVQITPDLLRKLANELESELIKAKSNLKKDK